MPDLSLVPDFVGSVAVMALLPLVYGKLLISRLSPATRNIALGLIFGAFSAFAMLHQTEIAPGVIVDMRSVPIVLAAAFLGPLGALSALAIVIPVRLGFGGIGATAGVLGMILYAIIGQTWAWWNRNNDALSLVNLMMLGATASLGLVAVLVMPWSLAIMFLSSVAPILAVVNLVTIATIGTMINTRREEFKKVQTLQKLAHTDPLTGLLNRRGFVEAVKGSRMKDAAAGQALVMLDLDHFKVINDTYGHGIGDLVLQQLGPLLKATTRGGDVVGRFGGEEFCVYLPDVNRVDALTVANRIRDCIQNTKLRAQGRDLPGITASLGFFWTEEVFDMRMAQDAADKALYSAKSSGRNRIKLAA